MQMTFRDIYGLVEQNVELQSQVQRLSAELEKRDEELKVSIFGFFFIFFCLRFVRHILFQEVCLCVK